MAEGELRTESLAHTVVLSWRWSICRSRVLYFKDEELEGKGSEGVSNLPRVGRRLASPLGLWGQAGRAGAALGWEERLER